MDFEKNLKRLDEIVTRMESGELALEESLKIFEEGVGISKNCLKQLDEAEQKVQLLLDISPDGTAKTKEFSSTDNLSDA